MGQITLVVVTPTKSNKTTATGSLANICNEEPAAQHNVGANNVAEHHMAMQIKHWPMLIKVADVDMFGDKDDEYFLKISDGTAKSYDTGGSSLSGTHL